MFYSNRSVYIYAYNMIFVNSIVSTLQIGETIADKVSGTPLPTIKVEEPTVRMSFSINTSPFVGREVWLNSTLT